MKQMIQIGDFCLFRTAAGVLMMTHPRLSKPVELPEVSLRLWLRRIARESIDPT